MIGKRETLPGMVRREAERAARRVAKPGVLGATPLVVSRGTTRPPVMDGSLEAHLEDVANPHQVTAAQAGAEAAGTAAAAVSAHDANAGAHSGTFDPAGTAAGTVAAHESAASPHAGKFEAAGAAAGAVNTHNAAAGAHAGIFDAAGTATGAVSTHNADAGAHGGHLLTPTSNAQLAGLTVRNPSGSPQIHLTNFRLNLPGTGTKYLILLHRYSPAEGTTSPENYTVGTLVAKRSTSANEYTDRVDIVAGVSQAGRNSGYLMTFRQYVTPPGVETRWRLVTCTYNGEQYLALDYPLPDGVVTHGHNYMVTFTGMTNSTNVERLLLVSYYDNSTNLPLNTEVWNSLAAFTPSATPMSYFGSGAEFAGSVRATGYQASDGTPGATANVAVAKVGGGTRTLHFKNGLYTGYTDS